ncbi:MAG: hypothetical protein K2M07_06925 [Muribaculaceae bacterium]|nr:hypothetical protein [Muribaculaceae bacterium]
MEITLIIATAVIVVAAIAGLCNRRRHGMRLIEIGSEREEMFLPGDPDPSGVNEYDVDE